MNVIEQHREAASIKAIQTADRLIKAYWGESTKAIEMVNKLICELEGQDNLCVDDQELLTYYGIVISELKSR
tara:strand:- start:2119 stop:2334 length:216 start_codon:yes stop_codon:yes gene_type:complete